MRLERRESRLDLQIGMPRVHVHAVRRRPPAEDVGSTSRTSRVDDGQISPSCLAVVGGPFIHKISGGPAHQVEEQSETDGETHSSADAYSLATTDIAPDVASHARTDAGAGKSYSTAYPTTDSQAYAAPDSEADATPDSQALAATES